MIRLKYDEKPRDPNLTISTRVNRWDEKSDIVWMAWGEKNKKTIVVSEESSDVPECIKSFIPRWRQLARQCDERMQGVSASGYWYVKGACSKAFFYDAVYEIDTGILYDIGDYSSAGYLFERIESEIEKDLYSIGAMYVEYYGMMD